jgi:hypothetical protein
MIRSPRAIVNAAGLAASRISDAPACRLSRAGVYRSLFRAEFMPPFQRLSIPFPPVARSVFTSLDTGGGGRFGPDMHGRTRRPMPSPTILSTTRTAGSKLRNRHPPLLAGTRRRTSAGLSGIRPKISRVNEPPPTSPSTRKSARLARLVSLYGIKVPVSTSSLLSAIAWRRCWERSCQTSIAGSQFQASQRPVRKRRRVPAHGNTHFARRARSAHSPATPEMRQPTDSHAER